MRKVCDVGIRRSLAYLWIDIVPIVPGRFLGFAQPEGEVHILSPGNAVACSGCYFTIILT